MSHPLIDRLTAELGFTAVSLDNHDEFVAAPTLNVLFFPGDPTTVKDATDVAVVLPELMNSFAGQLRAGVVADTFGAGNTLKKKYGFSHYPSLVFVREGGYIGTISRIRGWQEYLAMIDDFLVASPRRPPGFSIEVVSA